MRPRALIRVAACLLVVLVAGCGGKGSKEPTGEIERQLSAAEAGRLMNALVRERSDASVARIVAASDRRFIAVLIELMRASELGLIAPDARASYVAALETLSGKHLGDDWPAWVEWYASTSLIPPPGFTGWKGRLLAAIDPQFGTFLRDGVPVRVRVEEVQWGGVLVDGIPALDRPRMVDVREARYLEPGEPVFGISLNGDARAYPLRILDWHEMANDVVGGVPVSLAYCTLCGAAISYDGRASDGRTYTFGSSGLLFRSNKLMYDRQTRTLWNQITGQPVIGRLAASDVRLRLVPVVLTTWRSWRRQHPATTVLDIETGFDRDYDLGAAYGDYFASRSTMFPVWKRRKELPAKERVYALRIAGVPKAYPLAALAAERVVNDEVGGTPVVLVAARGTVVVAGHNLRVGGVRYEAGGEVRAYRRGDARFQPGPGPDSVIDRAGRRWRVTEEALVGPGGARAERVSGHLAYWFGWYSFFPRTLLYRSS